MARRPKRLCSLFLWQSLWRCFEKTRPSSLFADGPRLAIVIHRDHDEDGLSHLFA